MKVLFLTTDSKIGGAERVVLYLADGIRARGAESSILCLKGQETLLEEADALGIEARSLGIKTKPAAAGAVRAVAEIIRRERPDILHCHLYHANLIGTMAARAVRLRPVLVTEHGFDVIGGRLRHIVRSAYGLASSGVVAVSPLVGRALEKFPLLRHRVHVVENGIPEPRVEESRTEILKSIGLDQFSECRIVGCLSHFRAEKGVKTLVEALSLLKPDREIRAILVGSGPLEPELRRSVSKFGLEEKVRLTGFRGDATRILAACDIFALPSYEDGLPITLLEAAALGKPVAASHVGGIPEVIRDAENGLLVPPREPAALAHAIARLARETELRARLGRAIRATYEERYTVSAMIDKTYALYERILRA